MRGNQFDCGSYVLRQSWQSMKRSKRSAKPYSRQNICIQARWAKNGEGMPEGSRTSIGVHPKCWMNEAGSARGTPIPKSAIRQSRFVGVLQRAELGMPMAEVIRKGGDQRAGILSLQEAIYCYGDGSGSAEIRRQPRLNVIAIPQAETARTSTWSGRIRVSGRD